VRTVGLLLRQDPAFRVLPRAFITASGIGLLFRIEPDLAHGLATLNGDDLPGGFAPMYLNVLLLIVTFVLSANGWTRASRLSVSLPLPTRLTWLVRTASLFAVILGTTLAMALVLGVSVGPDGAAVNPIIALAALRATVTAALLTLLYQLPLTDRDRIPITAEYVIYVIFITLIVVPFSAADITSVAGSVFLLTITAGLGVALWLRTPKTWSVGPSVAESTEPVWSSRTVRDGEGAAAARLDEAAPIPTRPGLALRWTLFRSLNGLPLSWIIHAMTAGAMIVVTLEFFDGTNAFLPLALVILWHLSVLQIALERLTPFDPLPISRHTLWAHAFGPMVVAIVLGVIIGQGVYVADPTAWSQIHSVEGTLEVPWEYLEIAPDGVPPNVTAPWGESLTPTADPLWRGQLPALYDPYQVTAESSPRFVDYQILRAAAAVYGSAPSPEASWPESRAASATPGHADRETFLLELTRGRVAEGRSRSAAIVLLLFTLMVIVLMIPALLQYGGSVHRKLFKWALWGGLIVIGLLVVAVAVARLVGSTEVWFVGAVVSIGIRRLAEWLPLPTGLLWALGVTFWFGAYLLLGSIFKRIELPGRNAVNRFAEEY
jgi:hypothetical protein